MCAGGPKGIAERWETDIVIKSVDYGPEDGLTHVILATQEADIWRISVQGYSRQKVQVQKVYLNQ
jgi:hypothetical protein